MAILGVDDFKSKLTGGGARANLFKATLNFPGYAGGNVELASFMCKAAQLPGSIIAPITIPFRGRQLQIAGDRTFEPWSVTIINDVQMETRDAFERWMNGINQHSAMDDDSDIRGGSAALPQAPYFTDISDDH